MDYHNIIFFDGYCILCNKFVNLFLHIDNLNRFYFTPITSDYSQKILSKLESPDTKNVDTIIYLKNNYLFFKSDAIIEITRELGGIYKAITLLYIFPRSIRDWCYDLIARNRYFLFRKREYCKIISPKNKSRILE